MAQTNTPFGNVCSILGQLWLDYKEDPMFVDFIEYNDLGLPLAFAVAENIVTETPPMLINYITETWGLFLEALGIEDTGFETLEEILDR